MRFIVNEVTKIPDGSDRSLVLYGEVERGVVREGMTVQLEIVGQSHKIKKIVAENQQLSEASAGQQVGVILSGLHNIRVQLGEVLVEAKETES